MLKNRFEQKSKKDVRKNDTKLQLAYKHRSAFTATRVVLYLVLRLLDNYLAESTFQISTF